MSALATAPNAAAAPAPLTIGFALGWSAFCLLMILVGLQEQLIAGRPGLGWRFFDEATSMAGATVVVVYRWRQGPRDDALLDRPGRWFLHVLRWLPLTALAFVVAVYALRHAARAAAGTSYEHPAWPSVLVYESLKFAVFYLLFAGVQFGLRSRHALAVERERAERLQRLSGEARLAQLTQQMQPHFLFNALNTIAALVHDDADAADAALVRLAALLRAATDAARQPQHTLAEELALARSYAGLMEQRFGARVQMGWHEDPAAARCRVPALSLQPLLENCFVHVVERRLAPTRIDVSVRLHGARLCIEVADDGGSLADDWRPGVGLGNLRERLQALYGDAASLTLSRRSDGAGVVSTLELPLES